ncbi:MAG: DUF624 domain-containing protein [Acutalibacteraceae bacterium]|nr:DUF624 domain-containing protein [Acutalibacteraceae bacterium]
MGLFYNYNKEGPGVRKDGPKKRTFVVFLETFFRNVWKMIPVCFMYCLLFILPGLSAVGMTSITRSLSRNKHTFGLSDFFSTIKKNWKQALLIGILNGIITALLILDFDFFISNPAVAGKYVGVIGLGISIFLIILFTIMKFYIWFMVITFNMKASQIYLNSFKFFIINLKNNVIMLICIGIYWIIVYGLFLLGLITPLIAGILAVITIFVYPLYHYLVVQFGVFGAIRKYIIDPYYEENPDADIELRRNLGLDVGDDSDSDFEDLI